jgi:hypothetical protein
LLNGEQSSPTSISRQGFASKSLQSSPTFSKSNCSKWISERLSAGEAHWNHWTGLSSSMIPAGWQNSAFSTCLKKVQDGLWQHPDRAWNNLPKKEKAGILICRSTPHRASR